MKNQNVHITNQVADFVIDRDVLGQVKNKRTSIFKKMKYKSINAPDLKVSYAGLGLRTMALIIDLVIVISVVLLINMIIFPSNLIIKDLTIFKVLIGILIWIFYNGFYESSAYQATIGKLIFKLKVIDLYGKPIGFLRAISRVISTVISILPFGLGIWYITTDPKKRSWHDLIAGSFVIKA